MPSGYPFFQNTLFPLARKRLTISGEEHIPRDGVFLIVANHQSYLDPPMMGLVFIPRIKKKIGFITKTSVAKSFGAFGAYLGMIGINPENKAESLERSLRWLKKGNPVCIFPEGTRNYDATNLTKGKTGAARLALWSGVPVIPVGIRVPAGRSTRQSVSQFFLSRTPLIMRIGQPIRFAHTEDITHELLEDTTRTIMRAISGLCDKQYSY